MDNKLALVLLTLLLSASILASSGLAPSDNSLDTPSYIPNTVNSKFINIGDVSYLNTDGRKWVAAVNSSYGGIKIMDGIHCTQEERCLYPIEVNSTRAISFNAMFITDLKYPWTLYKWSNKTVSYPEYSISYYNITCDNGEWILNLSVPHQYQCGDKTEFCLNATKDMCLKEKDTLIGWRNQTYEGYYDKVNGGVSIIPGVSKYALEVLAPPNLLEKWGIGLNASFGGASFGGANPVGRVILQMDPDLNTSNVDGEWSATGQGVYRDGTSDTIYSGVGLTQTKNLTIASSVGAEGDGLMLTKYGADYILYAGSITAYNLSNGATWWSKSIGGSGYFAVAGDYIVSGGYLSPLGSIHVYWSNNGTEVCNFDTPADHAYGHPIIYHNVAVIGNSANDIYAFDVSTCAPLWNLTESSEHATPIGYNDTIIVLNNSKIIGVTYNTGALLWSSSTACSGGGTVLNSVADTFYVSCATDTITAYWASNGTQLWTKDTGAATSLFSLKPIVNNVSNYVAAVFNDKRLTILNATDGGFRCNYSDIAQGTDPSRIGLSGDPQVLIAGGGSYGQCNVTFINVTNCGRIKQWVFSYAGSYRTSAIFGVNISANGVHKPAVLLAENSKVMFWDAVTTTTTSTTTSTTTTTTTTLLPRITYLSTISPTDPLSCGNKSVQVVFTGTDDPGMGSFLNNTAFASFTGGSSTTRMNSSCTPVTNSSTSINYTCNIQMWYWDAPGTWAINVSVNTTNSSSTKSGTFTYNVLTSMSITPNFINFGTLLNGQSDQGATNDPFNLTNCGNTNISTMSGNITDLLATNSVIAGSAFSMNENDSPTGTALINETDVTLGWANVTCGNGTRENVYVYVDVPLSKAKLTHTSRRAWTITYS